MPFSTDPLEFDYHVHHVTQSPVLATLVTQYKLGEPTGMIASSWQVGPDGLRWLFHIRSGLHFDDGEPLLPSSIEKCWRRASAVLARKKSNAGFLEHVAKFKADDKKFTLEIQLKKPIPRLLDFLSFGQYAICSEKDFDPKSLTWRNPQTAIASGPYRIKSWTQNSYTLELRDLSAFPSDWRHPKSPHEIAVSQQESGSSDVIPGTDLDILSMPEKSKYSFLGGAVSNFSFVRCVSSHDIQSFCASQENRRWLFDAIAGEIRIRNILIPDRLLPVSPEAQHSHAEARIRPTATKTLRIGVRTTQNKAIMSFFDALRSVCSKNKIHLIEIPIRPQELFRHFSDPADPAVDLITLSSGVLLEYPEDDVRFMFRSKEGIQLPDPTGKISKILDQEKVDFAAIEKNLKEDALVLPLAHFRPGIWVSKRVDASLLNTIQPPTALHFLGLYE